MSPYTRYPPQHRGNSIENKGLAIATLKDKDDVHHFNLAKNNVKDGIDLIVVQIIYISPLAQEITDFLGNKGWSFRDVGTSLEDEVFVEFVKHCTWARFQFIESVVCHRSIV